MQPSGFITSDAMGQSTEMSPLVSILLLTFLKSLNLFNGIFNILVLTYIPTYMSLLHSHVLRPLEKLTLTTMV